jgi:hypothetical protein
LFFEKQIRLSFRLIRGTVQPIQTISKFSFEAVLSQTSIHVLPWLRPLRKQTIVGSNPARVYGLQDLTHYSVVVCDLNCSVSECISSELWKILYYLIP